VRQVSAPNDRRRDTAYTKRKAACVATSGPSLGRKRPEEGSDSGSEGTGGVSLPHIPS
jgi:hypothetical protein